MAYEHKSFVHPQGDAFCTFLDTLSADGWEVACCAGGMGQGMLDVKPVPVWIGVMRRPKLENGQPVSQLVGVVSDPDGK